MSHELPDPRTQTRTVTVEYLDELYAKADALRHLLDGLARLPNTWDYDRDQEDELPCFCYGTRMSRPHDEECAAIRAAIAEGRSCSG